MTAVVGGARLQALGKDSEAVLTLRGGGIVRVAAAIANVVYHATGTRIRDSAIPG